MKRFKLALAVFALVAFSAPARAEVAVVKAIDYCTGCAVGNLGLNLEGGASSVTLHALGMQFDANDGVWRGAGAFEVRSSDSGARVRFDPAATFILGTVDAPGPEGCSGKAINKLIIHGQDGASGHFTLIAYPENCKVGDGMCPESRVAATLDTDADANAAFKAELAMIGPVKAGNSWGRLKVRSK